MTEREEHITDLRRIIQSADPELVKLIMAVVELREIELEDLLRIRIKYTDDEYGAAARELGIPGYVYEGDAGMDLPIVLDNEYREHGYTIYPGERVMLHTGIIMEFPLKHWGRIIHRSSTERRYRLRVIEAVIDDYRNELICQVHNMNTFPIVINHGQRIVQLILAKVVSPKVEIATELRPSARDKNGFGSSGK